MNILNDLLQVAYVTNDMDFAKALFRRDFAIERWKMFDQVGQDVPGGHMINDVALAYCGSLQIEIIMPAGGQDGFYRDPLPADRPAVRFHHHGYLATDEAQFERIERHLAQAGMPIVISGSYVGALRYLYADARAVLGHYLEYICPLDPALDIFADVPRL